MKTSLSDPTRPDWSNIQDRLKRKAQAAAGASTDPCDEAACRGNDVRVLAGDSDVDCGFEIGPGFERFNQVNDVFSRSFWDDDVRSDNSDLFYATYRRPLEKWRKARGFRQRDYALRNASWHVTDLFAEMHQDEDLRDGFLDPLSMLRDGPEEKVDWGSPEEAAKTLKKVATTFGADLVGMTARDERWTYTERF